MFILPIVGTWIIFEKAGRKGWEALVPAHSTVTLTEIAGRPGWWFFLYLIPIANIVFYIMMLHGLSKRFGHGVGFTIGLLFLPFVFNLLLAFGNSQYSEIPIEEEEEEEEEEVIEEEPIVEHVEEEVIEEEIEEEVEEVEEVQPESEPEEEVEEPEVEEEEEEEVVAEEPEVEPEPEPIVEPEPEPEPEPVVVKKPVVKRVVPAKPAVVDQKAAGVARERIVETPKPIATPKPTPKPVAPKPAPKKRKPAPAPVAPVAKPKPKATTQRREPKVSESEGGSKKGMMIIIISVAAALLLIGIGVGTYFYIANNFEKIDKPDTEITQEEREAEEKKKRAEDQVVKPGTLNFEYGVYSGDTKGGKASGMGKMEYSQRTLISEYDRKKRYAEAGQYVIGSWYDNKLEFGKLYDSDGTVVGVLTIGRAE